MIRRILAYLSGRLKKKTARKEARVVFLSSPILLNPCNPYRKELFKEYAQYLKELEKKDVSFFLIGDFVQGIPTKGDK